ncbi:MAG: hypothetical protein JOZ75_08145 [Candidatus Dormibacteraeota bacterium]|nr:hypothetical protein [Candidatus Dormibacteraeota bacterium]
MNARAATSSPAVAQSTAQSIAAAALANDRTHFSGYRTTDTAYVPGLTKVLDKSGHAWYQTKTSEDDWTMFFGAPEQEGWKYVSALAVVNADTGVVESYQVRYSNLSADAVPGT